MLIRSLRCEVTVNVIGAADWMSTVGGVSVAAPTGCTNGVTVIDGQKGLHTDGRRVKTVATPRASEGGPVTSTAPAHDRGAQRDRRARQRSAADPSTARRSPCSSAQCSALYRSALSLPVVAAVVVAVAAVSATLRCGVLCSAAVPWLGKRAARRSRSVAADVPARCAAPATSGRSVATPTSARRKSSAAVPIHRRRIRECVDCSARSGAAAVADARQTAAEAAAGEGRAAAATERADGDDGTAQRNNAPHTRDDEGRRSRSNNHTRQNAAQTNKKKKRMEPRISGKERTERNESGQPRDTLKSSQHSA